MYFIETFFGNLPLYADELLEDSADEFLLSLLRFVLCKVLCSHGEVGRLTDQLVIGPRTMTTPISPHPHPAYTHTS